ncbi:MAG: flagellar hook-associated protein FlgL [Deltaproteobacteria bacterium]
MRITNNMLVNNMMYNMGNNLQRLDRVQQQLATGKKIATPSDDPIVASRALKMRTDVAEITQYGKNVEDASSWMSITESTLTNMNDILQRARELAVEGANGTLSSEDTRSISTEIKQLRNQFIQLSNTTYAGRYVFSGFKTDQKLVDENTGFYNVEVIKSGANKEDIKYEIGIGDKMNINVLGSEVLGGVGTVGTTPKVIQDFDNFISALNSNDSGNIRKAIDNVDENIDNILMIKSDIGARTNRLDLTKSRLSADETNFTKLMSQNEDADMAEVIMKLKSEENVYNASLSGGARIIQPTLVDFLK